MNQVELIGSFTKEFVFSHELRNKSFYISELAVTRKSGIVDVIPVVVDKQSIPTNLTTKYYLNGSYRVFNKHNVSMRYIYPECIYPVDESCINDIELSGVLYEVSHRQTPKGIRITDAMMRVQRSNTHDNIPLVFWNELGNNLKVGDNVYVKGRIQSRTYEKGEIARTITEVSVSKIL